MSLPSERNFDRQIDFDPAGDFEAFLKSVPAKWAVYLMSDAGDQPVQLLCVKNLRYSLERRLGTGEIDAGPSRRVNYREIVRRVRFSRVDSTFEADAVYLEAAREIFPKSYRGMTGMRPAWFVHVNPEAEFPRYQKTTDLSRAGLCIGPVEDKHAAARLIALVEDLFDLCRYYNLLVESPNAKACAYKEMGKCPAPCDGSISIEQYRHVIEWSARTLVDPSDAVRMHAQRMQRAAADRRFEIAGKIKSYVDQLSQLGAGPFRHARWLRDFQFVSFQHGPRAGTVKVFLITPGQICEVACMLEEPRWPAEVMGAVLSAPGRGACLPMGVGLGDEVGAERIGIVAHHLFSSKPTHGIFVRLDELDEKRIVKAYRDLRKRPLETESEIEGILKELQSL